jgi:hypothetical protein
MYILGTLCCRLHNSVLFISVSSRTNLNAEIKHGYNPKYHNKNLQSQTVTHVYTRFFFWKQSREPSNFYPDYGSSNFLWNVGNHLKYCKVSKRRKPQYQLSPPHPSEVSTFTATPIRGLNFHRPTHQRSQLSPPHPSGLNFHHHTHQVSTFTATPIRGLNFYRPTHQRSQLSPSHPSEVSTFTATPIRGLHGSKFYNVTRAGAKTLWTHPEVYLQICSPYPT